MYGEPRFIPSGTSVSQFIAELNASGARYVIPRWFENLPDVSASEHIDIFVHRADVERVRSLLRRKSMAQRLFGANRVRIDLKNAKGDYLPEHISARLLDRAITHHSGAKVPCTEDYFYSLAYRAVRHKDGLEATSSLGQTYGDKLKELAGELGLDVAITVAGLTAALEKDRLQSQ